jgi:hypothetical protein
MKTKPPKIILLLPLLLFLFLQFSCSKPNEPPIPNPPTDVIANTIKLTVKWSTLKSIGINFTKSSLDTLNNFKYELIRKDGQNNSSKINFVLTGKDTTYTDSLGLQQGLKYYYRVISYQDSNKIKDTSTTITAAILQPTSHNFEWTVDSLGEPGDLLVDAWGLDENNIWAVGGVHLPEAASPMIYWNGNKWKPINIYLPMLVYGIYGFSARDIWVVGNGNGNWGAVSHYNGETFETYYFDPWNPKYSDTIYALNAVWGSSPNDVWAVGRQGTIIHWDGIEWKKINSPTKMYLGDVGGNSSSNIYAIGSSLVGKYELLFYDGNSWKLKNEQIPPYTMMFSSIWIDKSGIGVIVGSKGLFYNGSNWVIIPEGFMKMQRVRGTGINNIFACGQYGNLLHYNGVDWFKYLELENLSTFNTMLGIAVFENEVMIVGYNLKGALVWHGKRK